MKKDGRLVIVILLMLLLFALPAIISCTQNARSRWWGGTSRMSLDYGAKLVNVTWKSNSLWVLTRPMREGEIAEEYEFEQQFPGVLMKIAELIQFEFGKRGQLRIKK